MEEAGMYYIMQYKCHYLTLLGGITSLPNVDKEQIQGMTTVHKQTYGKIHSQLDRESNESVFDRWVDFRKSGWLNERERNQVAVIPQYPINVL
jgi:hypothetical protein